ncbi:MAG: branched-chain-amino-acid transaminase [Chloroflexi bacterium]|nr:branched-chain-amino-acid transaminase [Chloroflexota bacterium]
MSNASANPKYLWSDGNLVEWEKAIVHITDLEWVGTSSVFEGIKTYRNPEDDRSYIFRLEDHMRRFDDSMRLMGMKPKWNAQQLTEEVLKLTRANGVKDDQYIRPFAYLDHGSATELDRSSHILITNKPFKSTLKTGRVTSAAISSWTRISDNVMPPRVKAEANYRNSQLAFSEARRNGYDEAILLNDRHTVAEGAWACVMIVKRGRVITPPVTAGVLESITRYAMLQMFEEQLGTKCEEREIDRTELYLADEMFLCGTGYEVTPVTSVDRFTVGDGQIGPLTARMIDLYHDVVRGLDAPYDAWRMAI